VAPESQKFPSFLENTLLHYLSNVSFKLLTSFNVVDVRTTFTLLREIYVGVLFIDFHSSSFQCTSFLFALLFVSREICDSRNNSMNICTYFATILGVLNKMYAHLCRRKATPLITRTDVCCVSFSTMSAWTCQSWFSHTPPLSSWGWGALFLCHTGIVFNVLSPAKVGQLPIFFSSKNVKDESSRIVKTQVEIETV
jgi:hypothetical protein